MGRMGTYERRLLMRACALVVVAVAVVTVVVCVLGAITPDAPGDAQGSAQEVAAGEEATAAAGDTPTGTSSDAGDDATADDGTELSRVSVPDAVEAPADLPDGLTAAEARRAVALYLERAGADGVTTCAPDEVGIATFANPADADSPFALPWWHYVATTSDGTRLSFWLVYDPYEMGPYCTDAQPAGDAA